MISITPLLANGIPPWIVEELPTTDFGALRSRVSRVATLDGGTALINSGVTEGDRTIRVEAEVSEVQGLALEAIRAKNPMVNMSTRNGFYYGAIETIALSNGSLKLTFLVRTKMA